MVAVKDGKDAWDVGVGARAENNIAHLEVEHVDARAQAPEPLGLAPSCAVVTMTCAPAV